MKPKTQLVGLCNAISENSDGWQRLAPFGEHEHFNDGKPVLQVVDEEAADLMIANANSMLTKLAQFNQGIPIFEGHPDVPQWKAKNPGCKAVAHGRIKELQKREDGIYYRPVFNESGTNLISGDAPPYSAASPNWRVVPISGQPGRVRPVFLTSLGLTNFPNIEGTGLSNEDDLQTGEGEKPDPEPENQTNNNTMSKEQLALLGLPENATPEQITEALNKLKAAAADADKAKADKTAAETMANEAKTKLDKLEGTSIANEVEAAEKAGRITPADKPLWEGRLKRDFDAESKALKSLPAVHNTKAAPNAADRRGEPGMITDRMQLVNQLAKDNNLNLANDADHDKAWELARKTKPELFGNAE